MRPNQESCSVKQPRGTYSNVLEHVPFEYLSSWAAKVAKIVGDCRGSSAATGFGGGGS